MDVMGFDKGCLDFMLCRDTGILKNLEECKAKVILDLE
jgi:hypothetical protein